MSTNRSDVRAARRGDADAFARLVRDHAGAVCAVTTAILGDATAGEEVGQEVFVCAWRQLGELRDPARFGAWLRGSRATGRATPPHPAAARETGGEALLQLADPAPDAAELLDREQREGTLWAALEGLDEDHREVLVLYYREGCSVGEVARQLELVEPTVRKRLSRARDRLRDGVGDRLGERLARTAPRAAFVAAVVGAVALLPAPARGRPGGEARAAAAVAGVAAGLWLTGLGVQVQRDLPPIPPPPVARHVAIAAPPSDVVPSAPMADPIPDHVVHAFLAAEDADFFAHGALDLPAVGRAAVRTLGGTRQGGSTLTQQLAKRMLLERMPEPTLRRKLAEAVLAVQLERELTKDDILERYLDGVYLGAGAYGVHDAARTYFDKPARALTLAEGALLAGIPAHPAAYAPYDAPEGALARRAEVLDRMVAQGWATRAEADAALAAALPVR
ncbi:MAG: sigma-70 family RNA polymerase sigma factor [Myxococcota bacterium]